MIMVMPMSNNTNNGIIIVFLLIIMIMSVIGVILFIQAADSMRSLNDSIMMLNEEYEYNMMVINDTLDTIKNGLLVENENLRMRISSLKDENEKNTRRISLLERVIGEYEKNGIIRNSIPYSELVSFLRRDRTDEHEYIDGVYVCVDFTEDLIRNAMREGIFMCATYLEFEDMDYAHTLVAVNTTDMGVVYVEPQTDRIITSGLNIGDDYCEKARSDCEDWIITKKKSCFD